MTDAEFDKKRGQPPPQSVDAFSAQADTLNLPLQAGIGNEQSLYPKVAAEQEVSGPPPGPALPQPKRNNFLFGFSDETSDKLKAVFQGSDLLPGSEPANTKYGPGELPDFLRATSTGIKALVQTSEKIKALFQKSDMLNPSDPNAYRVPNRNKFLFGFSTDTSDRIKAVFHGSDLLSDPNAGPPETAMQALFQTGTRIKHLFQRTRPPLHQSVPEEELDSIFDNAGSESLTSYPSALEVLAEPYEWTANPQESQKVMQENILRDLVVSKAIPRSARKVASKPKPKRFQTIKTIIVFVIAVMTLLVVFLVWQVGHSWLAQQFVNGGIQQLSKGDTSAAVTSFDRAIQVDGQNASAYFNRGNAYRQKGDVKKASDDYRTSLTLVRRR